MHMREYSVSLSLIGYKRAADDCPIHNCMSVVNLCQQTGIAQYAEYEMPTRLFSGLMRDDQNNRINPLIVT